MGLRNMFGEIGLENTQSYIQSALNRLLGLLGTAVDGGSGRLRVVFATDSSMSTVTQVNNIANVGGMNPILDQVYLAHSAFGGLRSRITVV